MLLFVLFLFVMLASFVTVLLNTEVILKKYSPYRNSSTIWSVFMLFVGLVVVCTVFFEVLPAPVCVIVPVAALVAAIAILYYYSGLKNRCAILVCLAVLFAGYLVSDWAYTPWMLVAGSIGLMSCSIIRVTKV